MSEQYDEISDAMRERWQAERSRKRTVPHDAERLPLWFWVAVAIGAVLFGVEAWMVYRVFAGWPVGSLSLLQKLAG
jgi:hypothetical protein